MAAAADGDLGRDAPIVFWHTGGLPGLFGHPAAATIARTPTSADPWR
jgi:D-cysteine desulfhydrase